MLKIREKSLLQINADGDERIEAHNEILKKKPKLQHLFDENFEKMEALATHYFDANGLKIELGSGAVSMKRNNKDIQTSDIVASSYNDMTLDAQNMHLDNNSVAIFFAQNVFHHFNNPEKFFDELMRVLKPGGGVIMLEPYHGPLASFIYKNFIPGEIFDKTQQSWASDNKGPMIGANQALSYIVFNRDKNKFHSLYPDFEISFTCIQNNYLRYILSGGLNFRKLIPDALDPLLKFFEFLLRPVNSFFGIHHIIVLKRCR